MVPSSPRKRAPSDPSDRKRSNRNIGGAERHDSSYTSMAIDCGSNMTFSQYSQCINMTLNSSNMHIHPGSSAFQNAHQVLMNQPSFIEAYNGGHVHCNDNVNVSNDIEVEKYRKWLMPSDPSTNQHIASEKHHIGTGSWFLENQTYKDWKNDPNSFMWIHGIAGAGKTVLFSTIVQNIQSVALKGSIAMAYFYCDISDSGKRTVTDILGSLIVTLLSYRPPNMSMLGKAYNDCMNGLSKPSNENLQGVLREFISGLQMTYILIDALDECIDTGKVLEFIKVLHGWELEQFHLLVTSRKEQYIIESMISIKHTEVDMSQMPVDHDIEIYVDYNVNSSMELRRWKPDEKGLIRGALLEKAKGMFRWVACQLDELKKCTKRKATLQYILDHLPVTLEETYDQILSRISPADATAAVKLLLWLAFAEHPLHIDYLAIIVEFDIKKKCFSSEVALSSPEDVLSICSSLVTKMGDSTVQLAHASVKQYILDKPRKIPSGIVIDPSIGNTFVGQCCLTYLICSKESCPQTTLYKLDNLEHVRYKQSLVRYSAKHWPKHVLALGQQDEFSIRQMKELFVLESIPFQNWVKIYNYKDDFGPACQETMKSTSLLQCAAFHGLTIVVEWVFPSATQAEVTEALHSASYGGHAETVEVLLEYSKNLCCYHPAANNALQAASYNGHKETMALLLERGADVNAQEGRYGNPLQAAALHGNKENVELLLERGADLNAQGAEHGNALQAASYWGHKEIIELLLERGADVNAQGGHHGNALQAAILCADKENIELLLERGADVNAQGGHCGNALQAAAWYGDWENMKLLLERGADVNAQGGIYGNALQAAAFCGNNKIIELLLERGADVNAQGGEYGNALQAASYQGHNKTMELLLERGADVNAQGGEYGNALQAAVLQHGNKENIELLLERGADVNALGGPYGNALQAAAFQRNKNNIKLLLERGADVNTQGGYYRNAFQAAARYGDKENIEFLLDREADVNAQGGCFGNALKAAAFHRNKENIKLLLERGANVNAQGGQYGNALQAAALHGDKENIELLLKRGADANAQGGQYGNALQAASYNGHNETMKLLLETGVDVNAQGGEYGNALLAASYRGHKKTMELLLERGADVNTQGSYYGNALQAASYKGHKKAMGLLLARGADVNVQGGEYGNALQAAAWYGDWENIELLLDRGADVNTQGGLYGNALQAAAFRGHTTIVQLLLKSGANVNCSFAVEIDCLDSVMRHSTFKFCSALQAASLTGHRKVVELLLAHSIAQEHLDNALCAALQNGHQDVANLLLSQGAKQK